MSSITAPNVPEISWLRALCDDNSAFLGGAESNIPASWEHCGDIVQTAGRGGFDNVLLPSG